MVSLPDKAYIAALNSVYGFGYKTVSTVISKFGSAKEAWNAPENEIKSKGFGNAVRERLIQARKNTDVELFYGNIMAQGITLLTVFDPDYPDELKSIPDPPTVLYIKGIYPDYKINIAIVGTRRATAYGCKTARKIASELASKGFCVVSGMARGIDTYAHTGAVEVNGSTVAVLGCGVDVIYPPENRSLAAQIQESGALISEYPLGTPPDKGNFPARNRIISGLSRAVVVVEAPAKSGALITADFALDQGREVFAVPGPITSNSSDGCNHLIKDGAKLVQGVEDILEEIFDVSAVETIRPKGSLTGEKQCGIDTNSQRILTLLSGGPVFLDDLCAFSGMSPVELNIVITQLELSGLVSKNGGRIFALNTK